MEEITLVGRSVGTTTYARARLFAPLLQRKLIERAGRRAGFRSANPRPAAAEPFKSSSART